MINDFKLYAQEQVYNDIVKSLVNKEPEQGGIIGFSADGIICDFYHDKNPRSTTVSSYVPDVNSINNVINNRWRKRNISFAGFVHTHINCEELSHEDITYARKVLSILPNYNYIIMGIVVVDKLYKPKKVLWYRITESECFEFELSMVEKL